MYMRNFFLLFRIRGLILCALLLGCTAVRADDTPLPVISVEMVATADNPDSTAIEDELSRITEEAIGCRVRLVEKGTAEHASFVRQLSSRNPVDIIMTGFTTPLADLKSRGAVLDLTDYLAEDAPKLLETCGSLLDACRINGRVYCIPSNLYPATQTRLFFRSDLKSSFGVEEPQEMENSYEALEAYLETIRESGFPFWPTSAGDGFRMPFYPDSLDAFGDSMNYSYGVMLADDPGRGIFNLYESEDFAHFCRKMEEWNRKGYLEPDTLLGGATLASSSSSGKVAAFVRNAGIEMTVSLENQSGGSFRSIPLDSLWITNDAVIEQGLAVSVLSPHPELCVKFMELIYTDPEAANLLNYGIEGIHYEVSRGQIIRRIPGDDGMPGYGNFITRIGDTAIILRAEPAGDDFFEKLGGYAYDKTIVSETYGYIFDPDPVRREVTAVEEAVSLYRPGLITGSVDVDALLPRFIGALKEAGIDRIIEENRTQYEAWKERR